MEKAARSGEQVVVVVLSSASNSSGGLLVNNSENDGLRGTTMSRDHDQLPSAGRLSSGHLF